MAWRNRTSATLYLIEFLHQTTTRRERLSQSDSCILLNFYIKPQPLCSFDVLAWCCILLFLRCILLNFYIKPQPCSTEFLYASCCILLNFYIKPQPCSTEFLYASCCILLNFYIKPQRAMVGINMYVSCILLNFYIKPQLMNKKVKFSLVVSY